MTTVLLTRWGPEMGESLETRGPSNVAYTAAPNRVGGEGQHLGLSSDVPACLWHSASVHTYTYTHTQHTGILYIYTHREMA